MVMKFNFRNKIWKKNELLIKNNAQVFNDVKNKIKA